MADKPNLRAVRPPGAVEPVQDRKPPREWRTRREPDSRRIPAPRAQSQPPVPVPAAPALPTVEHASTPVGATAASAYGPPAAPAPAAPPAPAVPPPPEAADLPHLRGLDRLVILVRDPHWVYAWWELGGGTLGDARSALGADGALVLRVYDISAVLWNGANHHTYFDVEIHDLASGWYLELGKPGASFVAEIGLRAADGRFLAILRSNFVTLPRDGMSDVVDEEWMVVEAEYRALFELAAGDSAGGDSGDLQRRLEHRLRADLESVFASRGPTSFGLSSPAARR
jgi:hypothetical protein